MRLPQINQNQQQLQQLQPGLVYSIKHQQSVSNANPKSIAKYAQISLANNDPTVKQISEGMNASLRNRKLGSRQGQSVQGQINMQQSNVKNQSAATMPIESYGQQNQSNSTQETTPEMSIKSTNMNSPVGQKKIGYNPMSLMTQSNNNNNNQNHMNDDIYQNIMLPQLSGNNTISTSSRINSQINNMKPNSPSLKQNHFNSVQQTQEDYYSNNNMMNYQNNIYLQKDVIKQSNLNQDTIQNKDQRVYPYNKNNIVQKINNQNEFFEEQQEQDLMNYNTLQSNQNILKQNQDILYNNDNNNIQQQQQLQQTLQKNRIYNNQQQLNQNDQIQQSQQQPQQNLLSQINLKTYFEQQNSLSNNLNQFISPTSYNSNQLNQPQQQYDSLLRKHQSLAQMSISKRLQLDPIKLQDLNLQPLSINNNINSSSTKKFLTRKPQTKILNRVFSSKSDVKPNKNMFLKNVPQTANSQQTTNTPLFTDEQISNYPQYNINTEPQLIGNGNINSINQNGSGQNNGSIYQQYNANFFNSVEKDILNEEIERKQFQKNNNNNYENNIYKQLDSYRNFQKQSMQQNEQIDLLSNTLSRGNKVIQQQQQQQRIMQQKQNIPINNNIYMESALSQRQQQLFMAQPQQQQQQQQVGNFKMSKQNFKSQSNQIPFQ